jgi:hypothetical protein
MISRFTIARARPELSIEAGHKETLAAALELPMPRLVELQENLLSAFIEEARFLESRCREPAR